MNTALVVGFNKKFEELSLPLIKSLLLFSKFDIIVVTYNYKSNINNSRIKLIQLDNIDEQHVAAIAKMDACIAAIDKTEYDNFIWVDTDAIATKHIDHIEKYFDKVQNYPLVGSHLHEYFLMTDSHHPNGVIPLKFVCEFLNVKIVPHRPWLHACLFIFNKNCKWFFEECILEYEKFKHFGYFWIHDELFINYLMSKYNFPNHLDVKILNIFKKDVFDEYLETLVLTEDIFIRSEAVHESDISSILPKSSEDLCIFHGITDVNFSKEVLEKYINAIIRL